MIFTHPNTKATLDFLVSDMTTNRSGDFITRAIHAIDHAAHVRIDMVARVARVAPNTASIDDLTEAIVSAGYTPVVTVDVVTAVSTFPWADELAPAVRGTGEGGPVRARSRSQAGRPRGRQPGVSR
jgi:hypothetical protein